MVWCHGFRWQMSPFFTSPSPLPSVTDARSSKTPHLPTICAGRERCFLLPVCAVSSKVPTRSLTSRAGYLARYSTTLSAPHPLSRSFQTTLQQLLLKKHRKITCQRRYILRCADITTPSPGDSCGRRKLHTKKTPLQQHQDTG